MAGERGRGRVTLRDVALAANVSTTTVSDSLNGSGSLPEKTRQRVRKIALELGYRPSVAARSLRNGRTGILVIAMLPSDVDAESLWHVDYFMRVMAGAAIEANQRGFFLAVAPAAMQLDVAHDGLIAVDPAEGDPLVESARQRGTPASTVGRTASDAASWVDNDWAGVVGDVLDHLERGGARRPMLIAPDSAASYIGSVEREFVSRCRRHGYAPRSARIAGAFNPAAARAAVRDILDGPTAPTRCSSGWTSSRSPRSWPRRTWGCAFPRTSCWSISVTVPRWPWRPCPSRWSNCTPRRWDAQRSGCWWTRSNRTPSRATRWCPLIWSCAPARAASVIHL